MTATPERLRVSLANDLSELTRLTTWIDTVGATFHLAEDLVYRIHVCLEEAVTNIVQFAYPDAAAGRIVLNATASDAAILVTIEDTGTAFDPLTVAEPQRPANLSDAQVGGLGVHFMRSFTNGLTYERDEPFNRLMLRFDR